MTIRLLFFGAKSFKFWSGAYYSAITCQEAISKNLAIAYKRKWWREESKNSQLWKKNWVPDMGGNAVNVPTFHWLCFFQLWKKTESKKSGGSNFFHSISPPCLGLTELKFSDSSVTSSCMLEPGFWIWLHGMLWHYNLHQTKHFTDFAPKKCNQVTIHLISTELNVHHIVRLTANYRVSG